MLSIFPELLPFGLFGTTIIRVVIGVILVYLGLLTASVKRKTYTTEMRERSYPAPKIFPVVVGLLDIIIGVLLIVGMLTQVMAILAAYSLINRLVIENHLGGILKYPSTFYLALSLISLSLLFLGAGAFAVDLPL